MDRGAELLESGALSPAGASLHLGHHSRTILAVAFILRPRPLPEKGYGGSYGAEWGIVAAGDAEAAVAAVRK